VRRLSYAELDPLEQAHLLSEAHAFDLPPDPGPVSTAAVDYSGDRALDGPEVDLFGRGIL
jgi:hypothetical protein